MNDYIIGFKKELEKNKSKNTIDSYMTDLKGFIKWFEDTYDKELDKILEQDIKAYKSFLLNVKKMKPTTINRKLNSLKKFNEYLIALGKGKEVQVKYVDIADKGDKEIEIIAKKDFNKLRRAFYSENNKRDICILEVLSNTGCRVSELINLEVDDIYLTERNGKNNYSYITIREGKGSKYREVPLNNNSKRAVEEYLKIRPLSKSKKLFVGQRGSLTRSTINRIVEKYCRSACIKRVKVHSFRHTLGTKLLKDKQVDLITVSKILGHSSSKVTEDFYINTSREDKQKALNMLDD